jgi:sodium transport system permease protein
VIRAIWTVFRKEVLESLRDRRTLTTALLFGPLLGPLLIIATLQFVANREDRDANKPVEIQVAYAERAPKLIEYLKANGVATESTRLDAIGAEAAVRQRDHKLVLLIPEEFATAFQASKPAPVQIYLDGGSTKDSRQLRRLNAVLTQYSQTVAQLRLLARGVDPSIGLPVAVQRIDISTPRSRAEIGLGMLSYILMFAMLLGGMYLCIDATAGERERGSLEALLTVPVAREHLVYGKILAASALMTLSLMLTIVASAVAGSMVQLESAGLTLDLCAATALRMFLTTWPFIPLGAALMTLIASFTKSYREAQSWLGIAMLVPTLPLAFASVVGLKPSMATMALPSLSQHFLIMSAIKGEPLPLSWFAISAGVSLLAAVAVTYLVSRLYQREAILG